MEKLAILEAYKNFLNSCNFNIQILIKNHKNNLDNIYSKIEESQFSNFSNNSEINNNIINLKNNYINHIKSLNNNYNITNKKYYLIISLNKTDNIENVNKINNFSLFSFFNFSKKLISNSNKNNAPSISNFDSNYYSLKSKKLPINIKSELNDINNIIYNTLTRACKTIRQMNNLEIFSLLKESLNIYDGK